MLSPRLTNCPECANIPSLLKKIDCKLAELGNSLYNNISYMLNQPIPAGDILQLIAYRRILMHKYCNPNYVHEYSVAMIASRVIRFTAGCVSRCNELERCLEEPCDIKIVPNPTTTSTSTLPITTTTSTSSTSSTTTTSTSSTSTSTTSTSTTAVPTTTTTSSTSSTTTTTTTIILSECAVFINAGASPPDNQADILSYNPVTNESNLLVRLPSSLDMANTTNKLWVYNNGTNQIAEYNITLSPWSITFNRYINYPSGITSFGAGLGAINDITLITTNNISREIIEIDITGSTAIVTNVFATLPNNYSVTGDIILTTTGKIICTINNNGATILKLVQYNALTGVQEVDVDVTSYFTGGDAPVGIFQSAGKLYLSGYTYKLYEMDLNSPYTLTLVNTVDFATSGASQAPECATVNLIVESTTTTTTTIAPINPDDIAGLWAWYKGDAGVIGGAQVTTWTDQSISGNDLLTELSAYPEAVTDTVGTLSTTVVKKVDFATLASMATAANFPNTNSTGSTMFVVCKVITSPGILQYVVKAPNMELYTNTTPAMNSVIGGGATLTQTVAYNQYYTFRNGTDLINEYFSVNNTTTLNSPDAAGFYLPRKFRIFAQNGPILSEQGDVAFAEIIVYNTSLTPTEILGVETYLRNKYNHY